MNNTNLKMDEQSEIIDISENKSNALQNKMKIYKLIEENISNK